MPAANTTKLSLQQKIDLIQHYEHSSNPSYSGTAKWGRSHFNRQTLSHVAVSKIVGKKDEIMASNTSRSDQKKQSVGKGKRSGQYPGMEEELAERITTAREQGIPYETWMLAYDAKDILLKKNHKASTRFKASSSWRRTFLERNGLAIRKVTNASTALSGPNRRNTQQTVVDYLRRARAFQMEEINDPVWGVTSPYGVFNRDKVPIALCPSDAQTVDEKGKLKTKPEQVKGVRIKPFRGPTTFKLEEVSTPSICSVCKVKQGNTKCEYKACKKCCVESYGGCVVHKPKEEEGKPTAKKQCREEVEEEELESIASSSEEEN